MITTNVVSCTAASEIDVNIMSFNIRYGHAEDRENSWDHRKECVYELLQTHQPDVIGLQEALRFQLNEIRDALPEYGEIGVGREGRTKGEYSAILYRTTRFDVDESETFWLSSTPETISKDWGNTCIRICTWARFFEKLSGKAFYLYNTHLDHESQISREKSVRLIMERIHCQNSGDPFVITGDFNIKEDNPVVLYLKGEALKIDDLQEYVNSLPVIDTFRERHPRTLRTGTFHEFTGCVYGKKIDYIFATPDVTVIDTKIIRDARNGRYPSDHYPITAHLKLPSASTATPLSPKKSVSAIRQGLSG